jgi:hypothetical protein
MRDNDSPPRGRALVRLLVGLAALLLAWLTEPTDQESPPAASRLHAGPQVVSG